MNSSKLLQWMCAVLTIFRSLFHDFLSHTLTQTYWFNRSFCIRIIFPFNYIVKWFCFKEQYYWNKWTRSQISSDAIVYYISFIANTPPPPTHCNCILIVIISRRYGIKYIILWLMIKMLIFHKDAVEILSIFYIKTMNLASVELHAVFSNVNFDECCTYHWQNWLDCDNCYQCV